MVSHMIKGAVSRVFRSFFRPQKLRLQVEWLTHTDERVLELLADGQEKPPSTLAHELNRSEEYIADRCRQLALNGLLERIERAGDRDVGYRISEFGERYLDGDVTADELSIEEGD